MDDPTRLGAPAPSAVLPDGSRARPALSPASRRARPPARAWFASDFHLHGGDPAGVARACRLLERVEEDGADALFLLGDVFRAWLGPASLHDRGLAPFLQGLVRLVRRGVRVVLLHGNHDFLLGPEIEAALGVEVVAGHLDVSLGGQRVRLLHGDALCTLDHGYHRLHAVLRCRPLRVLFAHLPPAALRAIADRLMGAANRSTGRKPRAVMDIVDDAARAQLAAGPDVLLCGHVHRARDVLLVPADEAEPPPRRPPSGRLVVLADFETTGSHARWADGELSLRPADPALAPSLPAPVVAIDGPAGSGKSTVARRLAHRLGWLRLDSGALYRAVTWKALQQGLDPADPDALARLVGATQLELQADGTLRLDGRPLPDAWLRTAEVSANVSAVSAAPAVRDALLPVQRRAALGVAGLVAEGRDMATVVFPDAALAVWLHARPAVRAARRLGQHRGEGATLEQVGAAIEARDRADSGRVHAPLRPAEAAFQLDTSDLDIEQVVDVLVQRLAQAGVATPGGGC